MPPALTKHIGKSAFGAAKFALSGDENNDYSLAARLPIY